MTAAKAAYETFVGEIFAGQRKPSIADFEAMAKVAVNPALGEVQRSILSLSVDKLAYRGDPPVQHVRLVRDASAAASPTVELADCAVSPTAWTLYSTKSGKKVDTLPTPAKPPFLVTVSVASRNGKWLVTTVTTHRDSTCSPA